MSIQKQSWINLDETIYAYIDEAELSQHKYFKLWHIAFRALTELGLDFFYQIKSVKLPVMANKTIPIPSDYLNYTKVGVFNDRGEVIPLVYNEKLTTYADLLPDRKGKTEDFTIYDSVFFNTPIFYNYWYNGVLSNIYGVPSGSPFVGGFKIDNTNSIILLDENFNYPYIVLEYVASPQEGEAYYIPIQFKEAVISYLRWKDQLSIPSKTHVNNASIQIRRHEFYNDRRLAIARWRPLHLQEALEWDLKNNRITIKA